MKFLVLGAGAGARHQPVECRPAPAISSPCSEPAKDLFPGAFDEKKAKLWAGLRPAAPENCWPTSLPAATCRSTRMG